MRINCLALALLWLGGTLPAVAQQILYVDSQGSGSYAYPTLQAAVDAALDGATIVIRPGSYPAASISGKRLDLVGLEGSSGERVRLAGLTIAGQGAGDMSIRDVDLPLFANVLRLQQCTANVLIERGAIIRVELSDSPGVALADCSIAKGVSVLRSNLTLYDTGVEGSYGAGAGIQLTDSELFAHGCNIRGGGGSEGEGGSLCTNGKPGGAGIVLSNSTALAIDTSVQGGPGGPPGISLTIPITCYPGPTGPVSSGVGLTIIDPPGNLHRLESSAVAKAGKPFTLTLSGNPGEHVFLFVSSALLPLFLPTWNGMLWPSIASGILLPTGVLPASGHLPLTYALNVPPPLQSVNLAVQGLFVHPAGVGPNYMSGPTFVRLFSGGVLLVDCNGNAVADDQELSAATDCDGDGKLDSCAIAQGTAFDCNGNGLPDDCDIAQGLADCDGDGKLDSCAIAQGIDSDCNGNGRPDACDIAQGFSLDVDLNGIPDECAQVLLVPSQYPNLLLAVTAALPGDTILLADGTYSGDGFRNIDINKALTIASENGPNACRIRLPGKSDYFVFTNQALVLRGIHLYAQPMSTQSVLDPTAINCGAKNLLVKNCRFEGLRSNAASVIYSNQAGAAPGTLVRIEDSSFVGNRSEMYSGAVYIFSPASTRVEILRCRFVSNDVGGFGNGGAVSLGAGFPPTTHLISDCLFNGNLATTQGGAVYSESPLIVRNCTFVGNIVTNQQGVFAGGAAIRASQALSVRNSIFWDNNSAGVGDCINAINSSPSIGGEPFLAHCLFPAGADQMYPTSLVTSGGPGLLDLAPQFVSATDWHLTPGSPAIDAGDPTYQPGPAALDLDGNPRLQGNAIDLGCYESSPVGP